MTQASKQYLDPKVLSKIGRLELKAQLIVEGYISGLHRSPYHGFSVEFAQHRQYAQGDDLRHLDWKVVARSDRYYIKQYEEETNLRSNFYSTSSSSLDRSIARVSLIEDFGSTTVTVALTQGLLGSTVSPGFAAVGLAGFRIWNIFHKIDSASLYLLSALARS